MLLAFHAAYDGLTLVWWWDDVAEGKSHPARPEKGWLRQGIHWHVLTWWWGRSYQTAQLQDIRHPHHYALLVSTHTSFFCDMYLCFCCTKHTIRLAVPNTQSSCTSFTTS
jgi:hypothetical protein